MFDVRTILLIPIKAIGIYWYLYILVVFYMLCLFFIKDKANLLLGSSLVLCFLQYYILIVLPDITIKGAIAYFGFFMCGIYIEKNKLKMEKINSPFVVIITVGIAVMLEAIIIKRNINNELITCVSVPVLGNICAMVICFALFLMMKLFKNKFQILSVIGKSSLEIYVIHVFFNPGRHLNKLGINNLVICIIMHLFVSISACLLIKIILKKIGLYECFFKPYSFLMRIREKKYS